MGGFLISVFTDFALSADRDVLIKYEELFMYVKSQMSFLIGRILFFSFIIFFIFAFHF